MPQITDSSRISNVEWENGLMTVTFKKDGSQYEYQDVPYGVYQELLASESKGRWFDQNVKGHFEHAKV